MRIFVTRPSPALLVGAGLLFVFACGRAGGADLAASSLGNCVSELEGQGDLAISICEARGARAVLAPGRRRCVRGVRLARGRLVCDKSDSASRLAHANPSFAPFPLGINAPVSVGDVGRFYGDRSAGDRFRVARHNGGLRIEETTGGSGSEVKCTFDDGALSCVTDTQQWRSMTYTLRLDGLEVTEAYQPRTCIYREYCSICGQYMCHRYGRGPEQRTSSFHPWN